MHLDRSHLPVVATLLVGWLAGPVVAEAQFPGQRRIWARTVHREARRAGRPPLRCMAAPTAYRGAVSGVFGLSVEPLLAVHPEVHPGGRVLFTSGALALGAGDVRAQIAEISSGLRRPAVAKRAFPFPPSLIAAIASLPTMLDLPTCAPLAIAEDALLRLPQLHQRTQFFATREAGHLPASLRDPDPSGVGRARHRGSRSGGARVHGR